MTEFLSGSAKFNQKNRETVMLRNRAMKMSVASILFPLLFVLGCGGNRVNRQTYTPASAAVVALQSPFLKVHMSNGDVYVLKDWQVSEAAGVKGYGQLYDFNRDLIREGTFQIPFKDVSLFETNQVNPPPQIAPMAVVTGASVVLTIYCMANPKACFGSCPTFYVWDGHRMQVQAEGFTASIAPALEDKDVDALYRAKPTSRDLEMWVTNEAMETHVIRYATLLLAKRPGNGRVFVTPTGEFYQSDSICKPSAAACPEGDRAAALSAVDGNERFSLADSTDLASKEEILLQFDSAPGGKTGLVLGYRQTLLTTFLFYQELAYMGSSVGNWIAGLQQDRLGFAKAIKSQLWGSLGSIEVLVQDKDGAWVKGGEFSEVGPIATNVEILPLNMPLPRHAKIKLRLTRGLWRLDYAALAQIGAKVEPMIILPSSAVRGDSTVDENALENLAGKSGPLVTLPGDKYSVIYRMPEDYRNYELFLETKGYYLEWMRKAWEEEENRDMALMMFWNPGKYFKMLAPEFKKIEPRIERDFWSSKYVEH